MSAFEFSVRSLSYLLAASSGVVFLFVSYSGYYTWLTEYYRADANPIEVVLAAVELMLFLPGLAPVSGAYYFFVHIKKAGYNLIGIPVLASLVLMHFLVSVPVLHLHIFPAIALSTVEALAVFAGLRYFDSRIYSERTSE